jgi:CheY-like chemotaxis protein
MARILLIDDSETQRAQVRALLENAGHSVMDASSGGEGMNKLISSQPECVVLDMVMPGMDGFKVMKSMKEQNFNTPIIVLSADVSQETLERCRHAGAKAYVPIPVEEKELISTVNQVLGR